jgi:hypothetical protein
MAAATPDRIRVIVGHSHENGVYCRSLGCVREMQ